MDFGCFPHRGCLYKLLLIRQPYPTLVDDANIIFKGQMYSQFSVKWTYITCVVLFEVGSAVCGAAPNMSALIVGRAICGAGGSGTYTGVMTLLSILTDEKERPAYLGVTGVTWGLGTVLGPIVGGAFTVTSATWRWAFYINLCIAGVCAPAYLFLIPSLNPKPETCLRKKFSKIDFMGTLLIVGVLVTGLMAISFGGVVYTWNSGRIIALFAISGVLIIVFWIQQIYCIGTTQETRTFPIQFLRNKELVLLFSAEACASTLTYIPIYFVPLYFQFAKNESALKAGVRVMPLVVFLVVTVVANGIIMTTYSRYMPWFLGGGIFGLIGAALLYTIDESTSDAKVYGYTIMIGFGAGCFVMLPFSAVQAQVEPIYIPVTVGFVCFAQLAAPAVTLSIANIVYLNEAANGIAAIIPTLPRTEIQAIISGVGSVKFALLSKDIQGQVVRVIVASLNRSYIIAMTFSALAIILSLFMNKGKMHG